MPTSGGNVIRDDFILRVIRKVAEAIRRAMGLGDERHFDEAHAVLDAASRSLVGLELDLAEAMPAASVVELLSGPEGADPARLAGLSQLLGARGELLAEEGQPERAAVCLERAITLGLVAGGSERLLPEERAAVGAEVERLARRLEPGSVPEGLLGRLMAFAEACGRLADAEDWLGVAADRGLDLGAAAFWARMARLDDAALSAGGLSRAEVEAEIARGARED